MEIYIKNIHTVYNNYYLIYGTTIQINLYFNNKLLKKKYLFSFLLFFFYGCYLFSFFIDKVLLRSMGLKFLILFFSKKYCYKIIIFLFNE